MRKNILIKSNHIPQHLTGGSKIIFPNLVIILFFIASITFVNITINSTNSAFALSYQSTTTLDFTINPTISLTVSGDLTIDSLMPGDYNDSNIITVTAESNSISGYNLSATASSNNLVNTANSNYVFNNLSTTAGTASTLANIAPGYWGYSYSIDNGTNWVSGSSGNTATGYAGLPVDNDDNGATGVRLLSTNTHTGSSSIQFKIGASATTTQVSGNYTGTVNFYAVANPSPVTFSDAFAAAGKTKLLGYYKMQDMTSGICQLVEQGSNTTLIDTRDDELYIIAKLKDDNCWMLDNLRLGGNEPITLTNQDTNMAAESWTLPANIDNYFGNKTTAQINAIYKNNTTTSYGYGSGKIGVYYNYCAASVGTYCYAGDTGVDSPDTLIDSSYDICPIGWRMPTGSNQGEYANLRELAVDDSEFRKTLSTPISGLYDWNTAYYIGERAYFWSSTRQDGEHMFDLRVEPVYVYTSSYDDRASGFSVRCLAE